MDSRLIKLCEAWDDGVITLEEFRAEMKKLRVVRDEEGKKEREAKK